MRIGIDIMGSDRSPLVLFEAIEKIASKYLNIDLVVFVTQQTLDEILSVSPSFSSLKSNRPAHLEFYVVSDVIEMNDDPLLAIRQKKNSSMSVGLKLLKKRYLDGFVSAGNTGALIAGATLSIPRLPSIKRPALLASLPTEKGNVAVIDVGGNVSCKAHHLLQFAQLAVAYQRYNYQMECPRVGLLNIGVESKKGTAEVRRAYQLLQESDQRNEMKFIGNVEGRELFQGVVDVLVTDGFTGNILLKTSEGVSSFMIQQLQHILQSIMPEQSSDVLKAMHQQFNDEQYPGALICGIEGIVVKCHGHSSAKGLFQGIEGAIQLIQNQFISHFKQNLIEPLKVTDL